MTIMRTCSNFSLLLWCIGVCVATISRADAAPTADQNGAQNIQRLIDRYCVSCHGANQPKGDLRLDNLAAGQWNDYDLLDSIAMRLEDGEMPPKKAKTPLNVTDRKAFVDLLKPHLKTLETEQLAGQYKKLTAQEYNHTLVDLFGFPVEKMRNLPFDSDHDLKKIGEHQVVTSYAVKKYYEVAREYLDKHILVDLPPVRTVKYSQQSTPKKWVHTSRFNRSPYGPVAGSGNTPRFMLRAPVNSYAEEGEYQIVFDWRCFMRMEKSKAAFDEKFPRAKPFHPPTVSVSKGVKALNPIKVIKDGGNQECRIDQPIRVWLDKETKFINFSVNNNSFKSNVVDPRFAEIEKSNLSKDEKKKAITKLRHTIKQENKGKPRLHLLIHGASIRGPLNRKAPEAQAAILGNLKRDDHFNACVPVIKRLARRLFRRDLDDAMVTPYINIARKEFDQTKNTYAAVKASLVTMLCSPHFVLKYEGNKEQLDDFMIASRLSHFLWNSTPDEELLKLAAAGKLKDADTRRQQAMRLLNDRAKSERFTDDFTHQWLGLAKFGQYTPNEAYIRDTVFKSLKPHIAREPQQFFNELLYHNRSALNFIHSDFVVWNSPLMSHYGRGSGKMKYRRPPFPKDGDRDQFARIELEDDPDQLRGGLITMASIMSLTTDGENTQPILRGVWIARHMLGMEIEAPATVPAIEVNLENVSKPREILAKHKTDPSCYACHVKFDHFGLAMEHYNVIGHWITNYVHPVQDEKGRFQIAKKDPIDANAETPDGQPMPGVKGVKQHLMANRDVVMRNLLEKLFAYAIGREVRYRDREAIQTMLKRMQANDYKLRDAVLELIASERFIQR